MTSLGKEKSISSTDTAWQNTTGALSALTNSKHEETKQKARKAWTIAGLWTAFGIWTIIPFLVAFFPNGEFHRVSDIFCISHVIVYLILALLCNYKTMVKMGEYSGYLINCLCGVIAGSQLCTCATFSHSTAQNSMIVLFLFLPLLIGGIILTRYLGVLKSKKK